MPAAAIEALLDPAFEIGGCYLLPGDTARELAPLYMSFVSEINGRGPLAWNHHWLFVPLRDRTGDVVGRIWADDPQDRLLPSRARLEALAVFANQATMAIVTAGQLEELRTLAQEDPLTGLPNRRAFMRDLESELERTRRHGRPLALVLCDVDDLKHINDTHGHPGGDRALCAVARTLRDALRAGDTAFRIGGDEFAVLLPETTAEQAAIVAARIAAPAPARRAARPAAELRDRRGARRRRRRRDAHRARRRGALRHQARAGRDGLARPGAPDSSLGRVDDP